MLHGARLPPPIAQYSPAANPPLAGAPTGPRGGYYEPPPAHIRTQYPMAGSEAPTDRAITPERPRKHQVATPPHASQVPPQADSLLMLLQRYPVMWQGLLALKNDQAAVQMHFVFGNPNVARDSLPCHSDGSTPPLRIAQRMRLEQTQLDGVARKMQVSLRKKNSMKKKIIIRKRNETSLELFSHVGFSVYSFTDRQRALHATRPSLRSRPHGRSAAEQKSTDRIHNLSTAEAGRRHSQHSRSGFSAGWFTTSIEV